MSDAPEFPILAKPQSLLRVPVGLSSPLWGFYAGAAMTGAAWWWMTRWARPENLEAMFGGAAMAEAPALEAPMALAEAVVEPVAEAAMDAAPEPAAAVAEAVVEPPAVDAPVGGEAAPIAPVLAAEPEVEIAPAPKPRVRKAEPKADPAAD